MTSMSCGSSAPERDYEGLTPGIDTAIHSTIMSKPWTIEVQNSDGTWTKLASGKAWKYTTAENAQKDIDRSKKWMNGRPARPVLIDE